MVGQPDHPAQLLTAGDFDRARHAAESLLHEHRMAINEFWAGISLLLTGNALAGRKLVSAAVEANEDLTVSGFYCGLSVERRDAAFRNDPSFDWLALQQAWALTQAGNFQSAFRLTEEALSASGEMTTEAVRARLFELHAECGMRLHSLNSRWEWLAGAIKAERKLVGTRPWISLYEGCLHFEGQRVYSAERCFQGAAAAPYRLSHPARGAFSFKPSLFPGRQHGIASSGRLVRLGRKAGMIYAFTCDQSYFDKFAPLIFLSSQAFCPDVTLHFHIVNPSESHPSPPGIQPHESKWENVGISIETYDGGHRSYYACARFIRAGEIAAWYDRPIAFSDIDACFTPASRTFHLDHGFGVALKFKSSDNHYPWRSIVADFVALEPTGAALDFMEGVGNYCLRCLGVCDGESWWVDQNALAIGVQQLEQGRSLFDLYQYHPFRSAPPLSAAPNHDARKAQFITENMTKVLAALS